MASGSEIDLVTGGAGYFGSLLVARLLEAKRRVRVFDLNAPDDVTGADVVRGDIRDRDAIRRACEGVSVVHHNVAMVPLAKDKQAFETVNRDGTRNMLEGAKATGVRKIIAMSSSAVFGAPGRNPVNEETVPYPGEDYGRAKLAAEGICHAFAREGLDVTIIRPRTIMGHGRLGIMQILFEWIRLGKNVPVFDGGHNVYQFVHADDLAAACLAAAERRGAATYNIGAAEYGTMRETLEGLIDHAGTRSRVVSVPSGPAVAAMNVTSKLGWSPLGAYHALMYGKTMYFDIAKAQGELAYKPRHGNVDMFCESYDWYLAHRDEVLTRRDASHHRSAVRQGILRGVSWGLSAWPR